QLFADAALAVWWLPYKQGRYDVMSNFYTDPTMRPTSALRHLTSDVKQANHSAIGFVPDLDGIRCRKQFYLAILALEVICCLIREPDIVILPRTDDKMFRAFFIEV